MRPVVVVDKIMETASRLFYTQGYNLTGINQIIAESNVAKPSLYAHFPSKNDLLLAYLDERQTAWFEGLEAFIQPLKGPEEKLLGMFDYRIERQIKSDFGGCAWTKITNEVPKEDKKVFEKALAFKTQLKEYTLALVKQLDRPTGRLLPDEMLAENIFLLLEGAQVMACIAKSTRALLDAKEIVKKLL